MPVDLDELFTALGRQADTLPLSPTETVIRRGRQRRRRELLAAAAAVLVLFTGAGVAARWHQDPPPTLPAAPDGRIRGMTAVTAPIVFGSDQNTWRQTGSADGRIFSISRLPGGEARVVALDATSGSLLWAAEMPGPYSDESGIIAVPGGPLLVAAPRPGPADPDLLGVDILDPATGQSDTDMGWSPGTQLVLGGNMLVSHAVSGWTSAYTLGSGADRKWQIPREADRVVLTVGISGELESGHPGLSITRTDDEVVQITAAGRLLLRDIRTGNVRTTLATGLAGADAAIAGDGKLFTRHGATIRATPLTGGKPATIYTAAPGRKPERFLPCGTGLLCVADGAHLVTVDIGTGEVLREVAAAGELSVRGSRAMVGDDTTTTIVDEAGRVVFAGTGRGRWIDNADVLLMSGSTMSMVSAVDGRRTEIGTVPERSGDCTWSAEFLACPTGPTMGLWRFTR